MATSTGTHTGDAFGFPATGKQFDLTTTHIAVVRNGRMVEHWWAMIKPD